MSAVLPLPLTASTAWRRALPALAFALLAVLLLYRSSFVAMVGIWSRSDTFAHAFLVPPIALWLVWRQRALVAAIEPRPQPWLLLPMLLLAALWLLGDMAGVNAVTQLAATALLVLAVPAVLGLAVGRQLAFPLGFLFFMVPIGEFLLPLLMAWTADFTVAALTLSGVPVYREGLQFVIPSGSWSVVEACSGVRYLIASFMVGTLFAYLNYTSLRRRLVFCAVALLVPVVANWLRAYMIVMIGHLSGNTLAVGVDHLIYGWVFFGVVVMLMFFIGARWAEPAPALQPHAARPAGGRRATRPGLAPWPAAALLAAVVALPQLALWQLDSGRGAQGAHNASPLQLVLPALAGNAAVPAAPALSFEPVFVGAAARATRTYAVADGAVTVDVAYYRQQGYGRKLVSSDNMLVRSGDRDWNHTLSGIASLPLRAGALTLRSAEVLGGNANQRTRLDVRQVYWVDGHFTASDHVAIVRGVLGRLAGRGDDGAVVTVFTEGPADATAARLQQFLQLQLPAVETWLQTVRAQR